MPVISIIVPVYKAEDYLHRCIDSLLAQSFKDVEIILVDDGSPDSCGDICDKYAEQYSKIKLIHKENGGVSSARNAGLDVAYGDWIAFVDTDDYIAPDVLEKLYSLAKNNADLAMSDFIYVDSNKVQEKHESSKTPNVQKLNKNEAFFQITDLGYRAGINVWSKLLNGHKIYV